jgi:uncharacterized membrane protein YvbJ
MVKIANELMPTLLVILIVVLLAIAIIYNSNRNQREVIETVKQSVRARDAARVESMIKSKMKDPDQWQKANDLMKAD